MRLNVSNVIDQLFLLQKIQDISDIKLKCTRSMNYASKHPIVQTRTWLSSPRVAFVAEVHVPTLEALTLLGTSVVWGIGNWVGPGSASAVGVCAGPEGCDAAALPACSRVCSSDPACREETPACCSRPSLANRLPVTLLISPRMLLRPSWCAGASSLTRS